MNDAGSPDALSRRAGTIEGKRFAEEPPLVTHDGPELFDRHGPPAQTSGRRRGIVLFHRGTNIRGVCRASSTNSR